MDLTDKTTMVRQGEELDLKPVEQFLKDSIPGLTGELKVEQFPSGYSNLTYLVEAGDKELVFEAQINKTRIKGKFDLGKMVSRGKLEI